MTKRFLLQMRDFCFILLQAKHGQAYAEKEYRFLLILILGFYYVAVWMGIGIFQFKAGIPLPELLKHSLVLQAIAGFILNCPYYFSMKFILKKLSAIPIRMSISSTNLKKAKLTLFFTFLLGCLLLVLVPWALDRFLPAF